LANIGRLVVFGCGGLVALVVLIVVVVALIGGSNQETAVEEKREQEGKEEAGAEEGAQKEDEPTAAIGETLAVGDVAWTVRTVRQATTLQDPFGQIREGNFIVVDVSFQNNSDRAVTLDTNSMTLLDSGGRESTADPDMFLFIPPDQQLFLENVNPGVAKQGQAIYSVAPGASGFRLQVGDTNPFGGEVGYIDLGF
jgi:Domain of unknown function (DUF4352)